MDLRNQKVLHKAFGEGKVVHQDGNYLTISFQAGEKKFLYPDAFRGFLQASDDEVAKSIADELSYIEAEKAKAIKEQEELRDAHIAMKRPSVSSSRSHVKIYPRYNVAFKCNFCDGGKNEEQVGFNGVCSDVLIRNNIIVEKRTWCGSDESACRKYLEGEISRTKLESLCDDGQYVCYESQMLRDWRALAGIVQTGESKGTPMKLNQVQPNSLCVLTTRDQDDASEKDRYIFAVFLVDETYEGDNREEGYVTTKSEYKLKLSPQEAHSMLFWKYHANDNQPETAVWSSGLHRYLNDEQAAQILRDIVSFKKGSKDEALALRFLNHFCTINDVSLDRLPSPHGALTID